LKYLVVSVSCSANFKNITSQNCHSVLGELQASALLHSRRAGGKVTMQYLQFVLFFLTVCCVMCKTKLTLYCLQEKHGMKTSN